MAVISTWLFETTAGADWDTLVGSGGVIDTGVFIEGAQSLYFDFNGGAAKYHQDALAASTRIISGRFYLQLKADAGGSQSMFVGVSAAGDVQLQYRVGRKLRVAVGATVGAESAALTLNTWYRIDFLFRTDSGTRSAAYSINGTSQTGATASITASDMTFVRLGNTGANTGQYYVDAVLIDGDSTTYPLGYTKTVAAANAAGTGTASGAKDTIAPTAGLGSGTGAAYGASDKVAASAVQATGTGAAYDATIAIPAVTTANAGAATGTGAASGATTGVAAGPLDGDYGIGGGTGYGLDARTKIAPTGGLASGTGAAGNATTSSAAGSGGASGTGSAFGPTTAVKASAGTAAGTGTANALTISTTDDAPGDTALGSGAARDASTAIVVSSGIASGTGSAYDASGAGATSVGAATAAATGAASDPRIAIALSAGAAAGAGSAFNPSTTTSSSVGTATGTGAAHDATVNAVAGSTSGVLLRRPRRRVSRDGFDFITIPQPSPIVVVYADVALGYGQAFDATTTWDDDETALLRLLGIAA